MKLKYFSLELEFTLEEAKQVDINNLFLNLMEEYNDMLSDEEAHDGCLDRIIVTPEEAAKVNEEFIYPEPITKEEIEELWDEMAGKPSLMDIAKEMCEDKRDSEEQNHKVATRYTILSVHEDNRHLLSQALKNIDHEDVLLPIDHEKLPNIEFMVKGVLNSFELNDIANQSKVSFHYYYRIDFEEELINYFDLK